MLDRSEIQIRDPFILPIPNEKNYYLFGTTDKNCWGGPATGFECYVSSDLEKWEGPFPAFVPPQNFWSTTQFWAPEAHRYQGRYYLFATFKADGVCRGTQILSSSSPRGPYAPHSDGPVTPRSWECLDGTLYVDDQGQPWMVFCHEWVQIKDGGMYALRLSADLKQAIAEPILLFRASQAKWAKAIGEAVDSYVTDGPFLHRCQNGSLLMLWSTIGHEGYAMGSAHSAGGILGPWIQSDTALFSKDGGHGMIFRDFSGQLHMTLHFPNQTPHERPFFIPVREVGSELVIERKGAGAKIW